MTLHKDLTGADLHEPKGVATASLGTVYVAQANGSGTWKKVGLTELDSFNLPALVSFSNQYSHPNINSTSNGYGITSKAGTLQYIFYILTGPVNVDTTVTLLKNGTTAVASVTFPAGTVAGSSGVIAVSTNNVFAGGNTLVFTSNGSGTGTASMNMDLYFAY